MLSSCVIVWAACFVCTVGCFSHVILDTYVTWLNLYVCRHSQFFFFHVWAWDKYVNPTSPPLPGLADADENCKRFIDRCMPEAFKKVSKEDPEIYCKWLCSTWFINIHCANFSPFCLPCSPSPVADQQCRTQMGHWDSRGNLQHAHVAGGTGCREGEARPCTCKPDGSPDYGVLSRSVPLNIFFF